MEGRREAAYRRAWRLWRWAYAHRNSSKHRFAASAAERLYGKEGGTIDSSAEIRRNARPPPTYSGDLKLARRAQRLSALGVCANSAVSRRTTIGMLPPPLRQSVLP